jgi:RHS repeat-associated protein
MATRNGYSITWASYNLPTLINAASNVSSQFFYGPDRQRKEQIAQYVSEGTSGTETTTYVFGLYELEQTPAQTHNKYFIQVPGGTQIIYDIQSSSGVQTTYITCDHFGSASRWFTTAGIDEEIQSYSAYGYRRSSNWSGPLSPTSGDYNYIASITRRGYTNGFHEVLDNLDLIHMNGRVYDPVIGRFLSPDPIVSQLKNSQSLNPYSYVQNRPLTLTDPTGLVPTSNKPRDDGVPMNPRFAFVIARKPGLYASLFGGRMQDATAPSLAGGSQTAADAGMTVGDTYAWGVAQATTAAEESQASGSNGSQTDPSAGGESTGDDEELSEQSVTAQRLDDNGNPVPNSVPTVTVTGSKYGSQAPSNQNSLGGLPNTSPIPIEYSAQSFVTNAQQYGRNVIAALKRVDPNNPIPADFGGTVKPSETVDLVMISVDADGNIVDQAEFDAATQQYIKSDLNSLQGTPLSDYLKSLQEGFQQNGQQGGQ